MRHREMVFCHHD